MQSGNILGIMPITATTNTSTNASNIIVSQTQNVFPSQITHLPIQANTVNATTPATPPQQLSQHQTDGSIDMGFTSQEEVITPNQLTAVEINNGIPAELHPKPDDADSVEKNIFLNFDNADLTSFVSYIAEIKKLNLIPDKTLDSAKISLSIRDPLTLNGAWNVFLTVIEMAGFSIIRVGDVYKVIPKDQKMQQPLPVFINIPPEQIPEDDSNCRFVTFLNNLSVPDYHDMVKSMLSDKGDVIDVREVNGFIITDKCLNIRSVAKLLLELDQMGGAETATFIRLKNANAVDVKNLIEVLMKKPEISPLARLLGKTAEGTRDYFPQGTKIIAEERLNALILIGDPKPIKKIEDFIINNIDTELKEAKSPLHVYELQYTDAQQIAELLKEVTQPPESIAGVAASKYGAIRGGVKYFRNMNFKVDKDGNRLIVSSTDNIDWKMLKKTIQDLDKPQPQVAIETLIVTVDVTDEKELSGATRNKKHGQIGKNIDFQSAALTNQPSLQTDSASDPVSLLGNMISQITKRQGLASATIGATSNIWSILQALKTQTNTSILSQPFLTVTNKTMARVKVGQEQRILQEQTNDGLKGYESVSADTELIITPQINLDGLIRLDIETNINEFTNLEGTTKVLRNLKTNVSVTDGQVLVLGGFVKTKTSETKYKTPILGDIPILGWLFKSQNRVISKEYIFIFMSPTILKPREIPGMGLYTKMKLHEATNDIEGSIQTKRTPDPVYNWFFNPEKENYSHKVVDFANARYQPTTVDIKNDPYYRTQTKSAQESSKNDNDENKISDSIGSETQITTNSKTSSNIEPQSQVIPINQSSTPIQASSENIHTTNITQPKEVIETKPQPPPTIYAEAQKPVITNTQEPIVQTGIVDDMPIENNGEKQLLRADTSEMMPVDESIDDFKAAPDYEKKNVPENINIDMKKRNRLKEFLSQNPMLSQNQKNNKFSSRKGLA